jgi:formylglycine-generating enzyme required for sulfatase activity/dienelactone hydrolase/predicted Ser/Thr protein kinase
MSLSPGSRLGAYEVLSLLGAGGMGEVYKAKDTRLDRTVAVKVLPGHLSADPERQARFAREARTIAGLGHSHICALYDVGREGDVDFLVMEYIDGTRLPSPCPVAKALEYAIQITDALRASHQKGIIHRDLKPANVMVTPEGQVKVLDFGLAKPLAAPPDPDTHAATATAPPEEAGLTREGVAVGTVAYMSPEQVEAKPLDARSDIFSFGAVLYELLTGRRAFPGDSAISTMSAILRDTPVPVRKVRHGVPRRLEAILNRCLEKDRDARYASAADLHQELVGCEAELLGRSTGFRALLQPRVAVPASLVLVAAMAAAAWFGFRSHRARWARNVALPEIARLVQLGPTTQAFRLAREAQRFLPDDRGLQQLWRDVAGSVTIRTTPRGAAVEWRDYAAAEDSPWESLGPSPVEGANVPKAYLRWRISKKGFDAVEAAFSVWTTPMREFQLEPEGSTPPGMVRVPGGPFQYGVGPAVELEDFWLDKYEVTNREYKEFVDGGGYSKREYWKHPLVKDGRELSWEQAMEEFRDTTGRPGPSTWALGTYADGQSDLPVAGVSWYEADAYATFAGKSLPTVYHWRKAADVGIFSDIYRLSNFGTGPARVGSYRGLSPWGAYDMAGNVKEWCWNGSDDRRYILGGAWGEPSYMFTNPDAQAPFRRLATYGFRCAKYSRPLSDPLTAAVGRLSRDYSKEKPASDDTFRLYENIYSYDRTPLNAATESVDDTAEHWRTEKIGFDAAYGNERVTAYLFLPRNAVPPYQTVVFFPGGYAFRSRSSENLSTQFLDFVLRSGHAVLYPIYKGTYERGGGLPVSGPGAVRDQQIQQSRDLGRSIDYLETRSDIDRERLAYYGLSAGAVLGPILTALEPRLKASIFLSGGFPPYSLPPEADPINFAPRAKVPVLMVNGRHDFALPLEASQEPMFRLLGAPQKDKRRVVFDDSGHFPNPNRVPEIYKEALDWLDRYLGRVRAN